MTQLVNSSAVQPNSPGQLDALLDRNYLAAIRRAKLLLRGDSLEHMLASDVIVCEAYIRMSRIRVDVAHDWQFWVLVVQAMRWAIFDAARKCRSQMEFEAPIEPWSILEAFSSQDPVATQVDILQALDQLAVVDERAERVVRLRFFEGCTDSEVARELRVSVRTVRRDWDFARDWLRGRLAYFDSHSNSAQCLSIKKI